jgi:hypothetical protein
MTLSYRFEGSGDPLLLLHAFGLDKEEWRPVVPLLAPHRRVLVVNLPGHGGSPMPPAGVPASHVATPASSVRSWTSSCWTRSTWRATPSAGGWRWSWLWPAAPPRWWRCPPGLWEREPLTRLLSFIATWVGTAWRVRSWRVRSWRVRSWRVRSWRVSSATRAGVNSCSVRRWPRPSPCHPLMPWRSQARSRGRSTCSRTSGIDGVRASPAAGN